MRVKFEATDAAGKVHKRSSMSHIYSHCVVIHFAAHPPSKLCDVPRSQIASRPLEDAPLASPVGCQSGLMTTVQVPTSS
jgi:hypothetical protein